MSALLEVNQVSKRFGGDQVALSDVTFSVNQGEFVSIIGPSGAGKSTLLRCINRMIDASSGDITFDNINVTNLRKRDLKKIRTKMGMIFQHYNLVNRLSVIENTLHGNLGKKSTLAGVFGLYSQDEKEEAVKILQVLGLEEHIYNRTDQLSGGQKQRVGIARALIQNPRMLLCDEPIASLDPNSAKIIMDHLRNISTDMGITVLVNLHQVDVAMKYSDQIIGINRGRVVYHGSPKNITKEDIQSIYGSEAEDLIFDIGGIHAS
ncbi:phosphonate ABC transporter ATP-binding protein [Bacillus vallismortis]|uniref:phosphonate ABC transporter ATP-binding protein n=1 Tax=Bacillus vallismortis TaxID=72361 RepID=UPI0022822496|nr:phosphonate ABC transporter ATP-binding protein [Bacillus vallismortis]MCI3985361.1 phosphonate ABC transporter ATP-binding protein [Bacillus vallismortis]MCI4138503.1 phosphonate ABC transporter ATP-binding protein [Bacillus vallismortis]MCY7892407.1 phosphonate ABC transporter ATP-binding protein [Bacillus vallismortis]MCY7920035.1 phosphonate ABC transporter ATP-binding protein [Bacillus vallismortis]